MTLVRETIPALFNGVSRQPATLRGKDQCEEQINAFGSVEDGLNKRPPTEHVVKVTGTAFGTAHVHEINRDTTEQYTVIVTNGDLKVYNNLTGAAEIVTFPNGKAYLTAVNAEEDFALVSVADYTFIVNKTVTCLLDGTTGTAAYPSTNANLQSTSGTSGTISNGDYSINPTGGSFQGDVQTFPELPEQPSDGNIHKVSSSGEGDFTYYYVRRQNGVWNEAVMTGQENAFDEATMPHALVRKADGSFVFTAFNWAYRRVGDATNNPAPIFVNRTINDVFFYQNRLGFLVDENVSLSGVGDFGNFWRMSQLDLLASDVMDVATSETDVNILKNAVSFDGGIVLFSDNTQFVLSHGDGGLTHNSISLDAVTRYKVNTKVPPILIGSEVYFPSNGARGSTIREYYVQEGSNSTSASDITSHCKDYVPNNVTRLTGDTDNDVLLVLSADATNRMYIYKYFWSGQEKIQSSWSHWEFPVGDKILSASMVNSIITMLIERADGVYLETIHMDVSATSASTQYQVHLDRRFEVTGVYSGIDDKTTFVLPYAPTQADLQLVHGEDFAGLEGALLDPSLYEWIDTVTIKFIGDKSAGAVIGGLKYKMYYEFSPQYKSDRDRIAITTGRLQIRTMTVNYADTAFFSTEVAPYGKVMAAEGVYPANLTEFTGRTIGSDALLLGVPAYHSGSHRFTIMGEGKTAMIALSNDTHVGCAFHSAEWEATYDKRLG